jgi:dTDP-4-dehydrorhamnose 3,5-epimerase
MNIDIQGVVTRCLTTHADARGSLTELFRSDELPFELKPEMGYVSITHPGVSRGPHEHVSQTDVFVFAGPGSFAVRLWDNRPQSRSFGSAVQIEAGAEKPMLLIVPPGVVHGYVNVSDEEGLVMNFPNRLYRGHGRAEPVDELRYEDDENSPFSMRGALPCGR